MNPREQGDLGEASAIEWLASRGASVYIPVLHSPDVDMVAWWESRWVGVQVKTSVHRTSLGYYGVAICTRGGNRSWSRIVKRFDASRCDYLFVLVGDGRRWFIHSGAVEAKTQVTLGGPKYSEYEVERGRPILSAAA